MQPKVLTSLRGAAIIALCLCIVSCKKSSNSTSPAVGTLSMDVNGKLVTFEDVTVDTTGGNLIIDGNGLIPGQPDSSNFRLSLFVDNEYYTQYKGMFADTSSSTFVATLVTDLVGDDWQENSGAAPSVIDITSNNGSVITGTIKGAATPVAGNATDTLYFTNGQFSVKL